MKPASVIYPMTANFRVPKIYSWHGQKRKRTRLKTPRPKHPQRLTRWTKLQKSLFPRATHRLGTEAKRNLGTNQLPRNNNAERCANFRADPRRDLPFVIAEIHRKLFAISRKPRRASWNKSARILLSAILKYREGRL